MKAKDLIALLQTIDAEAEVVTPGFDESGAASQFTLEPVGILCNRRPATPHFAPHECTTVGAPRSVSGYLLNGDW